MAEEKTWRKWEGDGHPEGKGGMSRPAQPGEVEGRERKMAVITCFMCGATGTIEHDSQWYTCWKCGGTAVTMVA